MLAHARRLMLGMLCRLLACGLAACCAEVLADNNGPAPPVESGKSPPAEKAASAAAPAAAAAAASAAASAALRPLEEVEPPLYYLKDKEGNLQAVPGFKFETFVELYKLKSELEQPERKPRYALQAVSAAGTAGAEYGELTVQVKVLIDSSGWVRVPLRLEQAILSEPVRHEGPGEHLGAVLLRPAGRERHGEVRRSPPGVLLAVALGR